MTHGRLVEGTRQAGTDLAALTTEMCSVASFDYVRREFGNQALDTPAAFYCIACIGGIRRPSWLTSFYLRLRQGRCVVIKCTQPTATDTMLYTPTQNFLSILLRAAAQIFEAAEGRPYLHRRGSCGVGLFH